VNRTIDEDIYSASEGEYIYDDALLHGIEKSMSIVEQEKGKQ